MPVRVDPMAFLNLASLPLADMLLTVATQQFVFVRHFQCVRHQHCHRLVVMQHCHLNTQHGCHHGERAA